MVGEEEIVESLLNKGIEKEIFLSPEKIRGEVCVSVDVAKKIIGFRGEIENILDGKDSRMMLIMGPCSIDDYDAAIEYAFKLKKLSDEVSDKFLIVMRTYFEKPRTSVGWEGLIIDPDRDGSNDVEKGYLMARKLLREINEIGLPCASELLDITSNEYIGDLISYAAIGARTSESAPHRKMGSSLAVPVGFKNATSGNLKIAVNAVKSANAEHIVETSYGRALSKGNDYAHVILRGGSNGVNYDKVSVEEVVGLLKEEGLRTSVIVDCSHANSGKDYRKQGEVFREVLGMNKKEVVGVMLESYLVEGVGDEYGQSKTDECVGWEESEGLVKGGFEVL
ncbi:3-deoxy-7-phosphoheptulonate synthase [archaeon]|nr:3-deoxy-7-phosphoheptulonate synthase [archaeon]